jgi:hypothetical protein
MFDVLFEFSDNQSMPNATTVVSTDVINWVENVGIENRSIPAYIVVRVNTVPSAGTSLTVQVYRHTSAGVGSGTLLLQGEARLRTDMTAGEVIFAETIPVRADTADFFGLVYSASGDMSSGTVDAFIVPEGSPLLRTATQVMVSNI